MTLTIRPARAADLEPAIELLNYAGLPSADLTSARLALSAEKDNKIQGFTGLEPYEFFRKLGYVVCDRASAPEVIRNTKEFAALCPGDAVLMSKSIACPT